MICRPGTSGKGYTGPLVDEPYRGSDNHHAFFFRRMGDKIEIRVYAKFGERIYRKTLKILTWTECPVDGLDLRSSMQERIPYKIEMV